MKTLPFTPAPLLAALVLSALAAGCAGPGATHARVAFAGADYYQIYLTGSHIPVLVPRSPTAQILPTISPLSILTPDDMVAASAPTGSPMH